MPYSLSLPSALGQWRVKIFDSLASQRRSDAVSTTLEARHAVKSCIVDRALVARKHPAWANVSFVQSSADASRALHRDGPFAWVTSSLACVDDLLASSHTQRLLQERVHDFWYLRTVSVCRPPTPRAEDNLWLIDHLLGDHLRLIPANAAKLPIDEFVDAVREDDETRGRLAVAGIVGGDRLFLWRASREILEVPLTLFRPSGGGVAPDFTHFEIIDGGQTLRFGGYESTVDVVLYQLDSTYRRRAKENELRHDRTFGASVKRLRLLRGLKQSDFAPAISEREIRRIEANEVTQFHQETREALARALGVKFEDFGTY